MWWVRLKAALNIAAGFRKLRRGIARGAARAKILKGICPECNNKPDRCRVCLAGSLVLPPVQEESLWKHWLDAHPQYKLTGGSA